MKKLTLNMIYKLYNIYNKKYFKGKLRKVKIKWGMYKDFVSYYQPWNSTLYFNKGMFPYIRKERTPDDVRWYLRHEMCHIYMHQIYSLTEQDKDHHIDPRFIRICKIAKTSHLG